MGPHTHERHQPDTPKRFQCRHIHTEGRRCGSASLRGEEFCYFHHTSRKPVANPRTRRSRQSTFDLPLPEDRGAIQLSIGEVLRRIAANAIDPRRAGLLLYGLQIAALNLPPHKPSRTRHEQESPVIEEIVTDPTHGPVAPAFELPDPDAPHKDSLTARLLEALRVGQEDIEARCRAKIEAELKLQTNPQPEPDPNPQPEPTIIPALNASASGTATTPGAPPSPVVSSPERVGYRLRKQTTSFANPPRRPGCPIHDSLTVTGGVPSQNPNGCLMYRF